MTGLWAAYKALSGVRSWLVNGGLILALLAAVWGYHWNAKRVAYNSGYAAAFADQKAASKKDSANAGKAETLPALIKCHERQKAGEAVIWNRGAQKCEKSN